MNRPEPAVGLHAITGETPESRRRAWLALGIICMVGFLNYVDRMVIAAVIPQIKGEFALTDTQIGLLSSVFAVVYAVGGLPLGRLADRFSRRRIIGIATAVWSAATVACGQVNSFVGLALARVAVGAGEAAYMPAAFSMVSDLFSPARRHFALSLLIVATSCGVIVGLAAGGLVATHYGWRMAFIAFGLPGLLIALAAWYLLREPVRGAHDIAGAGEVEVASFAAAVKALLANRLFVFISLTGGLNAFSVVGAVQWLPSFFDRYHQLPLATIGIIFGFAFGIGLMLGQIAGGFLSTRLARGGLFQPLILCVWSNWLTIAGFTATLWAPTAGWAVAATLLTTFIASLGHAAQSASAQNAVAPRLRGVAQAVVSLLVSLLGMALGPLLVGVISDWLEPAHGSAEALRYALTASQVLFVLAALTAWQAYRLGRLRPQG